MNRFIQNHVQSEQGSATLEFAFSAVLIIFLAFATIEYGMVFSEQQAVTTLAREGASLASRQIATNANVLAMMASTDGTLELLGNPQRYRIYLAQINGATTVGNVPTCTVVEAGTLTHGGIVAPDPATQCDLPNNLFNLLQWNVAQAAAGVNQFTVVKVYYQHRPLTPLAGLSASFHGPVHGDTDHLLSSQAIF